MPLHGIQPEKLKQLYIFIIFARVVSQEVLDKNQSFSPMINYSSVGRVRLRVLAEAQIFKSLSGKQLVSVALLQRV